MRASGLRRTEFNFRGDTCFHIAGRWAAKIEFCTSVRAGDDIDAGGGRRLGPVGQRAGRELELERVVVFGQWDVRLRLGGRDRDGGRDDPGRGPPGRVQFLRLPGDADGRRLDAQFGPSGAELAFGLGLVVFGQRELHAETGRDERFAGRDGPGERGGGRRAPVRDQLEAAGGRQLAEFGQRA